MIHTMVQGGKRRGTKGIPAGIQLVPLGPGWPHWDAIGSKVGTRCIASGDRVDSENLPGNYPDWYHLGADKNATGVN